MSLENYENPLKTVRRANFPLIYQKKLSKQSELKIKEYECQVLAKSLENCGL